MLKVLLILVCLLLNGCMVGPNYTEPGKPVVNHWKKSNSAINEKPFRNPEWWQVFKDPILTQLIQQGYACNLPLQSMGVKILQARAQLAQSVGQLYPQQQAMIGNYTYNRIGGGSLQTLLPSSFDTALLGFTANWELDFWGKYRRAIQANNANFLASIAAYDNALITLTADIASTYTKIRTIETQIKITNMNVKVQKEALRIAKARYQSGETNLVDVEQAKTELSETEANLPTLKGKLQTQKDALCVLLGTAPNQLDGILNKRHGIPTAPLSVAIGIPKETLARRPDIAQARMEAIAQLEMIGATKANLFPSLSLSGTFAFAANNIGHSSTSDLFDWSNRTIMAGPGLNWPLLNYGQITNAVRAQDAAFQQALLNYVNQVLKAQQEVQDSLTGFIEAKIATEYLIRANRSATETFRLAMIRYREGETDFTPVLNAEQQLLRIQLSLSNAQGDTPQALISLYRALGGGWQIRKGNDVVSDQVKNQMATRTNWGTQLNQQNHQAPISKMQSIEQLYLPKW